jgi:hypothetical protein
MASQSQGRQQGWGAPPQAQVAEDIASARQLAHALQNGWRPPAVSGNITLRQGEQLIAQQSAQLWQYTAEDAEYRHRTLMVGGPAMSTLTLLGSTAINVRRRTRAKRQSELQWRPVSDAVLHFTTMRLGLAYNDNVWVNIEYPDVQALDVNDRGITLTADRLPPLWFQLWNPQTHFVLLNFLMTGRVAAGSSE